MRKSTLPGCEAESHKVKPVSVLDAMKINSDVRKKVYLGAAVALELKKISSLKESKE